MPPHIPVAKQAYYAIVKKTNGSTGGGSKDSIFGVRSDDEGEGGKQEGGGGGDGDEDDELDFDNSNIGCDQGGRTSLGVDPTNLFGDVVDVKGVNGALFGDDAGADEPVAVAATASTAATSSTMSTNSGGKRSSGASGGGGGKQQKTKAFTQPLRIPRKSPSNTSDDGEDGYSFGNMMYMMMMQSRMDNERKGQQFKSESEQRKREYQLCWEEMAIARKESHEQRQLMNLMFMSMLNKNGGGNSNPPPSPSPNNNT